MEYLVSLGADPCKLVVGIPMYGRTATLADPNNHVFGAPVLGPGTAGNYTREAGFLAFYEVKLVINIIYFLKLFLSGYYICRNLCAIEKSLFIIIFYFCYILSEARRIKLFLKNNNLQNMYPEIVNIIQCMFHRFA